MFRLIELVILSALSVGLFAYCTDLCTRHNTFPVWFHPDEPGKAEQIQDGNRNFNHPQLMLETCLWLIRREGKQPDTMNLQEIAEIGRRGSAYLAASAAVMLAWAGYFAAGRIGFLLAGAGAGFCPAMVSHAHYFKEDASLTCGVAAVLLVGAMIARRRHWLILLLLCGLLGAAGGVAASGKYAGALMLIPAVGLVILMTLRRWWLMPLALALFALGAVGSWRAINHIALEQWDDFRKGFEREREHSISGHYPVSLRQPNTFFIDQTWQEAMVHVKFLAVAAPFALLLMRRRAARRLPVCERMPFWRRIWRRIWRRPPAQPFPIALAQAQPRPRWRRWLFPRPTPRSFPEPPMIFGFWLTFCVLCYAIALSYNTIPFYRYALPVTLMLYTLAAISVTWVARCLETRWTPFWLLSILGLVIVTQQQLGRCYDYVNQFAHDSRNELAQWVGENLGGKRIAADGYAELESRQMWSRPSGHKNLAPAEIYTGRWAADIGSIRSLARRQRVEYVIVVGTSFERFLDPHTIASQGHEDHFEEMADFYRTLFQQYPIVKQWKAANPMRIFMNPDIYIFQIKTDRPSGWGRSPAPPAD